MDKDRIVAIGFLTQRDLEILGSTFTRHFPVIDDDSFADLLDKLDRVEVRRIDDSLVLKSNPGS